MLLNRHSLGPQTWPVGLFLFPRIPLDRDGFVGSVCAEAAFLHFYFILFYFFSLSPSPCAVSSILDFYIVLSKCYPSVPFICPTLFTSLSALCVGSFPDDFNTKTDCYSEGCCLLKPFLPWLCYQALAWMICAGVFEQILTRVLSFGIQFSSGTFP